MKIASIILAAGFSSRMGVSKPLLPVGGLSAVRRCIDISRRAGAETIIVVTGHCGDAVERDARRADGDISIAYNARYADGMFSSIVCGATALPPETDGFFMFPVDYCAVSPSTLKKQISAFTDASGGAAVFSARDGHRGHPPLIPASLIARLSDYGGEGGLKGFIQPYPQVRVVTDDYGAFLDMDTPRDYAALLTHLGQRTYPDRQSCHALLKKYETPEDIIEHGRQVADLADKIARLMHGARLDMELLHSACLLHDIARREHDHASAGARLLLREGFPKASALVAEHMDGPAEHIASASAIDESALLFLADKLCRRGSIVPIERTIDTLSDRFPPDSDALRHAAKRMTRADTLLRMLFTAYGFGYGDLQ